jgi:hypothetical protein
MTNLMVDNQAPEFLATTVGDHIVPTRVRSDGFSLLPADGEQRRYLADSLSLDEVVSQSGALLGQTTVGLTGC